MTATTQTPGPADAAHSPSSDPGRLPRLGEVIRDAERLGAQMLAVLDRDIDPASTPTALAWPEMSGEILVHELLLMSARREIGLALVALASITELPLPPAGSAVPVPVAAPGEPS